MYADVLIFLAYRLSNFALIFSSLAYMALFPVFILWYITIRLPLHDVSCLMMLKNEITKPVDIIISL